MNIRQVVFVDGRVAGYQSLIDQLDAGTAWYLLNPTEDGVEQMRRALQAYSDLDAIQIVSHGAAGALYLGRTVLQADNLASYRVPLQSIGSALSATGDLLLYGCNVARGDVGQGFVNALASYTQADVAASDDWTANPVGVEAGDAVLERHSGAIETSALDLSGFEGALAMNTAPTFTFADEPVTTYFGTLNGATGYAIAIQSNGQVVVAGSAAQDFAVARYSGNGDLDTSFDIDGRVTTDFSNASDSGFAVAVQADGKIVVAGGNYSYAEKFGKFSLARYNSDGSLDVSFDDDGRVTTAFGVDYANASSAVVQVDGRILLGGSSSGNGYSHFALARYNNDGSLDTSFGGDGRVTTDFGYGYAVGMSVAVQSDGKILLSGYSTANGLVGFALARYLSDGSLDTSFDHDGRLIANLGYASGASVAVQADGRILLVGTVSSDDGTSSIALVRYNADGSPDTSFDSDGLVFTAIAGERSSAANVTIQEDGSILVAGGVYSDASGTGALLLRYLSDGGLDTSFGSGGHVTTYTRGGHVSASDVAVQSDGDIVLAGYAMFPDSSGFMVARYNNDGSRDEAFSSPESTLQRRAAVELVESGGPGAGWPVVLAPAAVAVDAELAAVDRYAGASLTLSRQGGANGQDVFSSMQNGTLSVLWGGSYFSVDGVTIGRVITNSGGTLALQFNANATQSLVNKAMQQIAYANTSDTPEARVTIDWTFSDGNTGDQGIGGALNVTSSSTIHITATNDAPIRYYDYLPENSAYVGVPFNFALPAAAFSDSDGDTLVYAISSADGTALPPWLTIDPVTGALLGTPEAGATGIFHVRITASDGSASGASSIATITVRGMDPLVFDGTSAGDYLQGEGGADVFRGWDGDDEFYGDAGDDTLDGGDGNDRLYGGADSDLLLGGLGDDSLEGGAGDDVIDGGPGYDFAVFVGPKTDYKLALTATGVQVSHLVGNGGIDELKDIERIQFVGDAHFALPNLSIALLNDTGVSSKDGLTSDGTVLVQGLADGVDWEYSVDSETTWQSGSGLIFVLPSDFSSYNAVAAVRISARPDQSGRLDGFVTVDVQGPSVVGLVAGSAQPLAAGATTDIAIQFDEAVTGFALDDLTDAKGGSFSNLVSSDGGTNWTVTFVPSSQILGPASIQLGADYFDLAGNAGTASNTLTIAYTANATVSDGYIRGADVYLDVDGDGRIGVGDLLKGQTAADGSLSITLDAGQDAYDLLATGGTDISTGLAFSGLLRAPAGSTMLSPLTTLLHGLIESGAAADLAAAQARLSAALGLPDTLDFTSYDPLAVAVTQAGTSSAEQKALALDVQAKTLAVANLLLTGAAALQGAAATAGTVTADQAGNAVLDALVQQIAGAPAVDLTQSATLGSVLNAAAADATIAASLDAAKQASAVSAASAVLATANQTIASATTAAAAATSQDALLASLSTAVAVQSVVQGDVGTQLASGQTDALPTDREALNTLTQAVDLSGLQLTADQAATADTTPPATPTLALANDNGASASDGITSDGTVRVSGLEAGAVWEFSTDGGAQWTAGSGSSFTLAAGSYAAGQVQARQADAAGNASAVGQTGADLTVQAGVAVDLLAYSWKAHTLLSGVQVQGGSHQATTGADGAARWEAVAEDALAISASRPVPQGEAAATAQAVNLQDAIAVLKMVVGLEVNGAGKPLSPYQAFAADFNADGQVGLGDAIGMLRHVVGLDAPAPQWLVFDEADPTVAARAGLQPGSVPDIQLLLSGSDARLGLVGVLRGDVDGSYAGPEGAGDLDQLQPGYFAELAADKQIDPAQFGLYP